MDTMQPSDSALISLYIAGQEEAFAQLLERHKARVFTTIMLIVRDEDVAEDLLQDTFIKAIHTMKSGRYNEEGKFSSWICRIAHNLAIDCFRREKRSPLLNLDTTSHAFNSLSLAEAATAQTKPAPAATLTTKAVTLKDGAFRRNGKVFRLRAGQATPLTSAMRFSNGLTLQPNGTLISKSGGRRQLAEGRAVNMQGDVVIYRDDMMTARAIEQYDEKTTGAKPTVVEIPASVNFAAVGPALQRTAQRLEQLRQLTTLLDERATAAAAGTPPNAALEQRIEALSQQLRP